MRNVLPFLLTAAIALSFTQCSKDDPTGLGSVIVKDDLNDPSLWSYEIQDSSGYNSASSSGIFSRGSLEIAVNQGEDCEISRALRGLEEYSNTIEESLEQSDTLILALDGVSADYAGMGTATFVFHYAKKQVSVDIPYGASSTEYLIYITNDAIHRVLINGAEAEAVTSYVRWSEETSQAWLFQLDVRACGADLYAYAKISIERLRLYQKS